MTRSERPVAAAASDVQAQKALYPRRDYFRQPTSNRVDDANRPATILPTTLQKYPCYSESLMLDSVSGAADSSSGSAESIFGGFFR